MRLDLFVMGFLAAAVALLLSLGAYLAVSDQAEQVKAMSERMGVVQRQIKELEQLILAPTHEDKHVVLDRLEKISTRLDRDKQPCLYRVLSEVVKRSGDDLILSEVDQREVLEILRDCSEKNP